MSDPQVLVASSFARAAEHVGGVRRRLEVPPGLVSFALAPVGRLEPSAWAVDDVWDLGVFEFAGFSAMDATEELQRGRDALGAELGAFWVEAWVDELGSGWVDFDRRPCHEYPEWSGFSGRSFVGELVVNPRPAELVPGWMKVELAVAGCWDVDKDAPAWDGNLEAAARPVSRDVAEAAFAGQGPVSEVLFGPGGTPVGLSRDIPLVPGS